MINNAKQFFQEEIMSFLEKEREMDRKSYKLQAEITYYGAEENRLRAIMNELEKQ